VLSAHQNQEYETKNSGGVTLKLTENIREENRPIVKKKPAIEQDFFWQLEQGIEVPSIFRLPSSGYYAACFS